MTEKISNVVSTLVNEKSNNPKNLADELGVSTLTVRRWMSGEAVPRPDLEGDIRNIFRKTRDKTLSKGDDFNNALFFTLSEIRELLHSKGRISSRQEALEEVVKLFLAHTLDVINGGEGISLKICTDSNKCARELICFVQNICTTHLPSSITSSTEKEEFSIRIKETDNDLAVRIVKSFEPLCSPDIIHELRNSKHTDIYNEIFGRFIVDSFQDEKELGQYLTPPEVVQFMVALGFGSLSSKEIKSIIDRPEENIILDPSCGAGSFLSESVRYIYKIKENLNDNQKKKILTEGIIGLDKSPRMIKMSLASMATYGVNDLNFHVTNSISKLPTETFDSRKIEGRVKLIFTNPPFGARFDKDDLYNYEIAKDTPSVDSEFLFLERYIDWLAPGGNLLTIIPDNILTGRGMHQKIRKYLADKSVVLSVISLPPVTFAAAGTSTKTSILHLRKNPDVTTTSNISFAVCDDIGYQVKTKGSQRKKIINESEELASILDELLDHKKKDRVFEKLIDLHEDRWDANYHTELPDTVSKILKSRDLCKVSDVAELVNERRDPRRDGDELLKYVEISNISASTCSVGYKELISSDAPSRARKVIKKGNVLVSTVRPDRGTTGVVPPILDGQVCSTGFAVLKPLSVEPFLLAKLLQTEFCTAQVMKHNIGIAYPAVDEKCLLDVYLPVSKDEVKKFADLSKNILKEQWQLEENMANLSNALVAFKD
jgi:type I restriction-modification system DNA methylase subunit